MLRNSWVWVLVGLLAGCGGSLASDPLPPQDDPVNVPPVAVAPTPQPTAKRAPLGHLDAAAAADSGQQIPPGGQVCVVGPAQADVIACLDPNMWQWVDERGDWQPCSVACQANQPCRWGNATGVCVAP